MVRRGASGVHAQRSMYTSDGFTHSSPWLKFGSSRSTEGVYGLCRICFLGVMHTEIHSCPHERKGWVFSPMEIMAEPEWILSKHRKTIHSFCTRYSAVQAIDLFGGYPRVYSRGASKLERHGWGRCRRQAPSEHGPNCRVATICLSRCRGFWRRKGCPSRI